MTDKRVVLREVAEADVDEAVAHYSAEFGEAAALGLVAALAKGFEHISRHPTSGSPRYAHEINMPGIRSWPLKRYPLLIFYVDAVDHVDVWRVLHAQRDIPAWLRGSES